jgi:hypothetical protein
MRAALVLVVVAAALLPAGPAPAQIEGGAFVSERHNLRVTLPRGWRIADQPAYPGVLVRMYRTRPPATLLVAVDRLAEVVARIEPECRSRPPAGGEGAAVVSPLEIQIACQQARALEALGFEIGTTREAARPFFLYKSDTRDLSQGVVVLGDRVFTVVLAGEPGVRSQYQGVFERTLRGMRLLEPHERREQPPEDAPADDDPPAPTADDGAPRPADPPG